MQIPELQTAIQAALAAGKIIRDRFPGHHSVKWKDAANPVTETDLMCENIIRDHLSSSFPDYGFLGEESISSVREDQPFWIIDPLDGTINFAHGYPHFAVSIALQAGGRIKLGVVYQPMTGELFTAEIGKGAKLNGEPIKVSRTDSLSHAVLASGFPYDSWANSTDNTAEWTRMLKRALSLRCDGSASLDFCYVASGRLDAFWELDLEPWDMAAGGLICAEANGKVTRINGTLFSPMESRNVAASNGLIHAEVLNVLKTD